MKGLLAIKKNKAAFIIELLNNFKFAKAKPLQRTSMYSRIIPEWQTQIKAFLFQKDMQQQLTQ